MTTPTQRRLARRRMANIRKANSKRFKWTGFYGKTFWDWMQLLIIPLVLTVGGYLFTVQQSTIDRQNALDQQQAAVLQTYISNIQDLLLNHNLLKSKKGDDVAILARAQTLVALRTLDPDRKGILLQFLYASGLVTVDKVIVSLDKADLSNMSISSMPSRSINVTVQNHFEDIDLQSVDLNLAEIPDMSLVNANLAFTLLQRANLSNDDLSQAILTGSLMEYTNLQNANLQDANLGGSILVGANLEGALLDGADLQYTILDNANLRGARITQQQLKSAISLRGATMPDGSVHP